MSQVVVISEAVSIALHGLTLLAKSPNKITSVNDIAEITSSSRHHVAKIFQRLVKEGWVISQRGPSGGFSLKIKPENLTFLQIYETIDGVLDRSYCPFDKKETCPFDTCLLRGITQKMTMEFISYLESQTLADHI
jgi:Rrf2 family protein